MQKQLQNNGVIILKKMLYVRKLFTQDLRDGKQIAFPKEPSLSFFGFDYINKEEDRNISFKFHAAFNEFQEYEGKVIKTRLYSSGSEARMDGQVKAFIRDILKANVDDLLIFKNKGNKHTEYEFMFLPKGNPFYSAFLALINGDNHSVCSYEINAPHVFDDSLSLQQIYYGAPGTGKSHIINDVTKGESVIRTTFHPDSDYSTFVGAYKPTTKELILRDLSGHPVIEGDVTLTENKIVYEFVDQSFLKAYIQAWKFYAEADGEKEPKKQFLVIEEINRGNCAQIFGDLFQLLDRNNAGFSDYPINADNDMKKQLAKAFKGLSIASAESINAQYNSKDMVSKVLSGEILLLPNNLYIWATMNTSDQSLFPIDSAFKRRWEWKYMKIKEGKDENGNSLDWKIVVKDADGNNRQINGEDSLSWWTFIQKINDIIASMTSSADKQLGYFFCKAKDGVISGDKFVSKVVFYLWNDVFKDYGFEDASLFRYETVVDGKSTEKDLTFPDFYDEEGENINADRLVDFLEKVLAWQKPEDNA